uniref:Uncharacterized protein n=1 Tax=Candidatus Kentrum eta TaxID=2126337 RepID=A0A450V784_9GAMM|nr:MAG: hypothetical protein BECKH772A_GA0070896_101946 [Candidatus Kentron sp. H]VFK00638.1 MAG: hypothetical protein BECKH772B_GA0070898_101976 [Candidatus Kentron sp. H]VFK04633.1 MAG: hypothetical protein BECKH772C_GA0070978_101946 [Candidatus Kentron sp. H]
MPDKTDIEKVAELLKVQFLPPLDPSDAQSLHKALPGAYSEGKWAPIPTENGH